MQFTVEPTESCSAIVENDNPDISSVHYLSKCLQTKPTFASARDRAISLCKKIEVGRLHYLIAQIWMPLQQDQNT